MSPERMQQNLQVTRHFLAFARAAGVLMVLVAALVLVGWWWDIPLFIEVIPGQQSMKASAAAGFFLSGLALLSSLRDEPLPRRLGKLLSLAVLVLGAASGAQYLWPLELGLDHWFPDSYSVRHGLQPGRMTQAMAVAFVMLGGFGLLGPSRRWLWLRETAAVIALAIAMLALASYRMVLAGWLDLPLSPIAIHTALLLLLAALGWMSSTPHIGLTRIATADSFGGVFARRLLLPSLLLPVLFTLVFELLQPRLGASEALASVAVITGGSIALLVWWIATLLDRVERQRREAEGLRDRASTDTLTGLGNRRAFDDALASLLSGRREHDAAFSLLMVDLDMFKSYNDEFGHLAGDEVLRISGRLLRAALRQSDLPARYGGEEFALLLVGTDTRHALGVAERIRRDFQTFAWPRRLVTVSIGVAEARSGDSADDLVQRADAALYEAKHVGRNRVEAASAGELN